MKNLLIDDLREVGYIENIYSLKVTNVARTFAQGINALKFEGPFDFLLLDHDLASYDDEGEELNGYHVMRFLEENPELLPKRILIISSNPVGRARMQVVIDKLYKSDF